jgi:hypothetical protein
MHGVERIVYPQELQMFCQDLKNNFGSIVVSTRILFVEKDSRIATRKASTLPLGEVPERFGWMF